MSFGKSDAPPAPDYAGAAQATAQGNLEATRAAAAANRVNQVTPYGNLSYTQNPTSTVDYDAYNKAMQEYQKQLGQYNATGGYTQTPSSNNSFGTIWQGILGQTNAGQSVMGANARGTAPVAPTIDQFTTYNPDTGWTATQTLTPEQQKILDATNSLNLGLMDTAGSGLQYANDVLSKPGVDMSKLPSVGIDPGQSYQDAIMTRLQPQIDQQNSQFEQRMANQGIAPGTEAYDNAKRALSQQQNDMMTSATVQGFNTGLTAQQNAFQQEAYNQMQPINVINALRTGSQVQNPSFVNVPQQATTTGADMLGAAQAQGQYDMNAYNAQTASSNSLMGGLFNLGAAYMMKPVK